MNIEKKEIDALNAEITIAITPEDYKEQYDKKIKEYRKNANLPGFRPGKVPVGLIKKEYGPSILAQEVNDILSKELSNYIEENNLNTLGQPLPVEEKEKNYRFKEGETFEFSYELGLAPDFELKLSKRDKVEYNKVLVDDTIVNKQIEDFSRRFGKLEPVEEAGENDMLFGQFNELDENNEILEDGIQHSSTISLQVLENEKVKKELQGKKLNDSVILNPHDVSKGETDMAAMLNITKDEASKIKSNFQYTITEIKRMNPHELNQDLFNKVYGEGNIESEEAFKNRIKEELEKVFLNDSEYLFKKKLTQKLIDKTKIDLPNEFLKKWIKASNEKTITDEEIDREYEAYANDLRWQLIKNKIVKDNEIKVEFNEVLDYTKGLLSNQYAQYGMPLPEPNELEENAKNALSNQQDATRIYETVYENRVVDHLRENIKLDEKELPHEEFVKQF